MNSNSVPGSFFVFVGLFCSSKFFVVRFARDGRVLFKYEEWNFNFVFERSAGMKKNCNGESGVTVH